LYVCCFKALERNRFQGLNFMSQMPTLPGTQTQLGLKNGKSGKKGAKGGGGGGGGVGGGGGGSGKPPKIAKTSKFDDELASLKNKARSLKMLEEWVRSLALQNNLVVASLSYICFCCSILLKLRTDQQCLFAKPRLQRPRTCVR